MRAGKTAADEAAAIQRIGRQQVHQAHEDLHPHRAAQQVCGRDERLCEEVHIAAGAQEHGSQHQRRGPVGQGTGERDGKLPYAGVCVFLALGIGVGEESADGEEENGAQAQSEPGGDEQACGLPYRDGRCNDQEQADAPRQAG